MQTLNDSDIPPNQAVQISGHKNINSLNNYSKLNPNQSKKISDILTTGHSHLNTDEATNAQSGVSVKTPAVTDNSNIQPCMNTPFMPLQMTPFHYQQPYFTAPYHSVANHNHPAYPMLMGSTFNGPVTFQFESSSSKSFTHTQTSVCTATLSQEEDSPVHQREWKRIRRISDSDESI